MPREIVRDPNCLHCAINALVDRWIEEGRVSPTETVQRIAEVLGGYIGLFAAADRKRAIAEAIRVIDESCAISVGVHRHRPLRSTGIPPRRSPADDVLPVDTATGEAVVAPVFDANRKDDREAVIDLNFWRGPREDLQPAADDARVLAAVPVADPVAAAIIGFAENAADWEPFQSADTGIVDLSRRVWKGPAATLLGELAELVADDIRRARGWPRDAARLKECLRRAVGELRIRGIRVDLFTEREELPDGRKGILRPAVTIVVPAPEMTGR